MSLWTRPSDDILIYMNFIGVIEGFFGPQWSQVSRMSYASFLSKYGGNFYIYAPKQDPFLRKKWRDPWSYEYLFHLRQMRQHFHRYGIQFGIGFSPFGVGKTLSSADKVAINEKVSYLEELNIDILGLFFDDMPISENLAQTQLEIVDLIQSSFKGKIIFCPSFYSPDPILEKVFGPKPPGYLEEISVGLSSSVMIAWTGPKVISTEISEAHLRETEILLRRKPFIWDNLFANDGPKNCKFLKLKSFQGRSKETVSLTSGYGLNMMNQPNLSKITYLSSFLALSGKHDPARAWESARQALCSEAFSLFLDSHMDEFLHSGLDNILPSNKKTYIDELKSFSDEGAKEVIDWLSGNYNVGSECLTD
jgi:hyaluronoglucosaminidase